MVMLLALPVVAVVASVHRFLQVYAPSNVLIRRVRALNPSLSTLGMLVVLAGALLIGMRMASIAVAAGAPGWLNLVVMLLAWDAVRVGLLAGWVACRWLFGGPFADLLSLRSSVDLRTRPSSV